MRRLISSCATVTAFLLLPHATFASGGTPRFAHTATLLSNSSILVAGGVDNNGNNLNTA